MAVQDSATLKSYFETGDKPTQSQFGDLIDTTVHGIIDVVRDHGAVGDGATDDTAAIQAALDAAVATSGRQIVRLSAGDYLVTRQFTAHTANNFDGCLLVNGDDVEIQGPGRLVFNLGEPTKNTVVLLLRGDNITIDGLQFNNNFTPGVGSESRNWNIGFGEDLDDGSALKTYKNHKILNTRHTGSFFYAFSYRVSGATAQAVEDVQIDGNHAVDHASSDTSGCYNFGGSNTTDNFASGVRMTNNYAENIQTAGAYNFLGVEDSICSHNVAKNCEYAGVETENTAGRCVISDNVFINCHRAVWIDDSQHVIVIGNIIDNPATRDRGIFITRETETADFILVEANIVINSDISFGAIGAAGGDFGTIIARNNIVVLDGSSLAQGLDVASADRLIMSGNVVIGAATNSIEVSTEANQIGLIQGNMTAKVGAESSTGFNNLGGTGTLVFLGNNFENDVANILSYNNILDWNSADPHFELRGIRFEQDKGTDVASASTLTLANDGNYFVVTGSTTINHITTTDWGSGAEIILKFSALPTLTHNAGSPPAGTAPMLLEGSADLVPTTANNIIRLILDGTNWRQSAPYLER